MKKIFYVAGVPFCSNAASALQVANTCAELGKKCDLTLLCKKHDGDIFKFYSVPQSFKVVPIDALSNKGFQIRALKYLFFQIIRLRLIDIVVISRDYTFIFLCLLFRLFGIRLVYEMHYVARMEVLESVKTWGSKRGSGLLRINFMERKAVENASVVVVISNSLRRFVLDNYNVKSNSIIVIPDSFNSNLFNKQVKYRTTCKKIVYVGSGHPWKGLPVLIDAFKRVKGMILVLVGNIDKKLVKNVGNVELVGQVQPERVPDLLLGCDISVVPFSDTFISRVCASPLKLFEYMSLGLPVIASNLPTISEVIKHGFNGLLFKTGSAKDLADKINLLCNDYELRKKIGVNAFNSSKRFTYKNRARKFLKFL